MPCGDSGCQGVGWLFRSHGEAARYSLMLLPLPPPMADTLLGKGSMKSWWVVTALLSLGSGAGLAAALPPSECVECHTDLDHRILHVDADAKCASCHKDKKANAVAAVMPNTKPHRSAASRTAAQQKAPAHPSTNGDMFGSMVLF